MPGSQVNGVRCFYFLVTFFVCVEFLKKFLKGKDFLVFLLVKIK